MLPGKLDTDEELLATELKLLTTLELLFTLEEIEAILLTLLFTLAVTLLDEEGTTLAAILLDDEGTTTTRLLEWATIELLLNISWLALALEIELIIDATELMLLGDALELLSALLLLTAPRGAVVALPPPHAVNIHAPIKAIKAIFLYIIINLKLGY